MEILEERRKIRDEVIRGARDWARGLPFKASAILIGSYARGDFNLWSDVDIVFIAEMGGNPLERLKRIDFPPGFEVIPLTLEEFLILLRRGNPIAVKALNKGIVLRDDFDVRRLRRGYY